MANGAQDLGGNIQSNATGPSSATADGITVAAQPIPDVIAADKYLAGKQANGAPPFGIRFAKIVSPGAQQGCSRPWSGC